MWRRAGPVLLVLAMALPASVRAGLDDGYADILIARAIALDLAEDPYWRRLVYYVPARNASGWRSEATGADFFNSPDGRDDPAAELNATILALFAPPLDPVDEAAGRQHPQCAFIARYHWLSERLGIDDTRLPHRPCERFDVWFDAIDPARVALVFAADYVGNPSSAFGHTLLRLDRPSEDASRLVSYAVNYAAIVGDVNPVSYAWNGLTGGYPGYYSLLPYYDKVREYNDLESRDMWEYELTFTTEEIARMMRHLWEVGSVPFDYYFLKQNCSYRLLGLLEVARPGVNLTVRFPVYAIPTDTVRVALEEEDLLRAVVFRPSAERRLKHGIVLASAGVRGAALAAANGVAGNGELEALPPAERAHALELAHDYLHYHFLAGRLSREIAAPRMHRLLVERSGAGEASPLPEPPRPATRPDQGHPTGRLGLGAGYGQGAHFTELQWRAAYHDLADPQPGYRHGAQIDFLGASARYEHDRDRWRIERVDVAEIWSLAPRNAFLQPVSWKVGGGLMRDPLLTSDRPLVGEFHGGAGLARGLDRAERLIVYGLVEGRLIASRHIDDRLRLGVGPRIGIVHAGRFGSLHASAVARRHTENSELRHEARLEQSLALHQRLALRLRLSWAEEGGQYYRERILFAHWYY